MADVEMFDELSATLIDGKTVGIEHPDSARAQLKGLSMFLAQAGMGQRVHAGTGYLRTAFSALANIGGDLPGLVAGGAITDAQAVALVELTEQIAVVRGREESVFRSKEETDTGFAFLWSRTFEDDEDWNELRRRARRCFTALRREGDPIVG